MAKIAIIKTGGKQYKVKTGDELKIEKLAGAAGDEVKLETLLVADENGKEVEVGKPTLGEKVTAKILEFGKAKKVTVVKFKNKVRYKRTRGHRQPFVKVQISTIA
jgi:large subunit ribosomal protein L21